MLLRLAFLTIVMLMSPLSFAGVISEKVEELSESYQKCEELYEDIRNSECADSLFGLFGRIYVELGMSFTERQVKFQNIKTKKDAFILSSGFKPRPVLSVSLSDSYFGDSSFGYGLGFSYFDDYAVKQVIKRGDSSSNQKTVDLDTYSGMNVIAVSPSVFYSYGRNDDTPYRFVKMGVGFNLMYSKVRGTAYLTELKSDEDCYQYGSDFVDGKVSDKSGFKDLCESTRFNESGFGSGIKVFLGINWNSWTGEVSVSAFQNRSSGDYRYVTQQAQFAISRKLEF